MGSFDFPNLLPLLGGDELFDFFFGEIRQLAQDLVGVSGAVTHGRLQKTEPTTRQATPGFLL